MTGQGVGGGKEKEKGEGQRGKGERGLRAPIGYGFFEKRGTRGWTPSALWSGKKKRKIPFLKPFGRRRFSKKKLHFWVRLQER